MSYKPKRLYTAWYLSKHGNDHLKLIEATSEDRAIDKAYRQENFPIDVFPGLVTLKQVHAEELFPGLLCRVIGPPP